MELVKLSGNDLYSKICKLVDIGMMYIETDVIHLTGEVYLWSIPFCAN